MSVFTGGPSHTFLSGIQLVTRCKYIHKPRKLRNMLYICRCALVMLFPTFIHYIRQIYYRLELLPSTLTHCLHCFENNDIYKYSYCLQQKPKNILINCRYQPRIWTMQLGKMNKYNQMSAFMRSNNILWVFKLRLFLEMSGFCKMDVTTSDRHQYFPLEDNF